MPASDQLGTVYCCPVHGEILGVEMESGEPSIDICPVRGCREPLEVCSASDQKELVRERSEEEDR